MEIDVCPRWVLAKLGVPNPVQPEVAMLLSSIFVLVLPPFLIRLPHVCLMQRFLHIPCPGCGILHSITSLLQFHFAQAWKFNPAGIVLSCMLLFQIVARPVAIVSERTRPAINQLSRRGSIGVLVCLIVVWISRLFLGGFHIGINLLSEMQRPH